ELAPYEVARLVVQEVIAHRAGDLADDLTAVCLDWRGPAACPPGPRGDDRCAGRLGGCVRDRCLSASMGRVDGYQRVGERLGWDMQVGWRWAGAAATPAGPDRRRRRPGRPARPSRTRSYGHHPVPHAPDTVLLVPVDH